MRHTNPLHVEDSSHIYTHTLLTHPYIHLYIYITWTYTYYWCTHPHIYGHIVMVNFMFQLDRTTGSQGFGQASFWVCLWGSFWMRLTSESTDWVKQIAPLTCEGPILSAEVLGRMKWLSERALGLPHCFICNRGLLLPMDWNSHPELPWFSRLQTSAWSLQADLGLQLAKFRSWDFSA